MKDLDLFIAIGIVLMGLIVVILLATRLGVPVETSKPPQSYKELWQQCEREKEAFIYHNY